MLDCRERLSSAAEEENCSSLRWTLVPVVACVDCHTGLAAVWQHLVHLTQRSNSVRIVRMNSKEWKSHSQRTHEGVRREHGGAGRTARLRTAAETLFVALCSTYTSSRNSWKKCRAADASDAGKQSRSPPSICLHPTVRQSLLLQQLALKRFECLRCNCGKEPCRK